MRALLFASLAISLSACVESQRPDSAWLPARAQAFARRAGAQPQPIERLCLAPQTIAPGITVFCGGFTYVAGLATDESGNLYVASDAYSRRGGRDSIVRITQSGHTSLVSDARLAGLRYLAVDATQNVYASTTIFNGWHSSSGSIYKIPASDRSLRRIVSGLSYAYGLATDAKGHLYAATSKGILKTGSGRKRVISKLAALAVAVDASDNLFVTDGKQVSEIEAGGTIEHLPGNYTYATGIAVDEHGTVFIGDQGSKTLSKISAHRKRSIVAGGIDLTGGIALGINGDLYLGGQRSVQRLAPDGTMSSAAPMLDAVSALASDGAGHLYVALPLTNSVVRIAANGTFTSIASNLGSPSGLALDREGNLYVAQGGNIDVVAQDGTVKVIEKGLAAPSAIAVDHHRNIYVADGKSVKRISPGKNVKTLLTLPRYATSVSGVAVDPQGNVYASVGPEGEDCYGPVYKISPTGNVTQIKHFSSCFDSLAADANGNLYGSSQNGIIWRIAVDGRARVVASKIGPAQCMTVDDRGLLYAYVNASNEILRISP